MAFKISCPHCEQSLEAEKKHIGLQVECLRCLQSFTVEDLSDEPAIPVLVCSCDDNVNDQKRCPFCGELILVIARKCKHCGEFFDKARNTNSGPAPSIPETQEAEKTLWTGSPSHDYYLLVYVIGTFLILVYGFGLIVIIWALLDRTSNVFTVTNKRVMAKSGIIARSTQEVSMKDIRSISLQQSVIERIFSLGTVQIGSAGTAEIEVQFEGIPDAPKVKEIISCYKT
ncbi:MAG: PH domain-containing protein [Kiritimatiellae bacterium]|nr:PH domain-containing protein [Kiritimatiellia bacterium]